MTEREREADRRGQEGSVDPDAVHPVADVGHRATGSRSATAHTRGRLMARPEKGLAFDEALDESMRDHRAVYAALAK